MKRYLPSVLLLTVMVSVTIFSLLNVPSDTPWPMAFLIVAGFAAIYGFLDYFLPFLLMAHRLRRLHSSRVPGVSADFLGDMARAHSQTSARGKWSLALLPYPELIVRMTLGANPAMKFEKSKDYGWAGEHLYELVFALQHTYHLNLRSTVSVLARLRTAGLTDFTLFHGYCESAGVEAATLAIEYDLPLEYARELAAE